MSTVNMFCLCLLVGVLCFVAGILWQQSKPTYGAQYEALARHVPPRYYPPLRPSSQWIEGLEAALDALGER